MIAPIKQLYNPRVLVVDDEPAITQMLSMLLETRGYKVIVAHSGQEAFQKASEQIDLIILDLLLPDVEGYEVCHRLKSLDETRNIPIIILSGRGQSTDKVEVFHLGADDYLTKPFENEELFVRMESLLKRHLILHRNEHQQKEVEVIQELKNIIDHQLVIPHFQPIYYLKPFKLFGMEVLTRPQTQGMLADPEVLFRVALNSGLYFDLEMISWRKALKIVSSLIHDEQLFLNCDPYLIEGDHFQQITKLFKETGLPVNNVFLEITERSSIGEFKVFFEYLKEYRDYGFHIAIDDVGGGYASLESIVETRPHVVKIDRRIVSGLHNDSFKISIVKLLVSFCRENGIISVAEGIENIQELDTLMKLGVNAGQGYYLYKPTSVVNLESFQYRTFQ